MTDNIPPEIAGRLSDDELRHIAENGSFSAPSMAKEILAFRSAPARIRPEVRQFILDALDGTDIWTTEQLIAKDEAIAFVEALP